MILHLYFCGLAILQKKIVISSAHRRRKEHELSLNQTLQHKRIVNASYQIVWPERNTSKIYKTFIKQFTIEHTV